MRLSDVREPPDAVKDAPLRPAGCQMDCENGRESRKWTPTADEHSGHSVRLLKVYATGGIPSTTDRGNRFADRCRARNADKVRHRQRSRGRSTAEYTPSESTSAEESSRTTNISLRESASRDSAAEKSGLWLLRDTCFGLWQLRDQRIQLCDEVVTLIC
jgi:hypothetical protein